MSDDHPLVRLETLALIGIGGFAGSNLRFLAAGLLADVGAVLLVNVVGSATLGFLAYESRYAGLVGRRARVVLATGFLSLLTTYSALAVQAALAANPLWLVGIVTGNYGLGFAGVLAGRSLARRIAVGGDGA